MITKFQEGDRLLRRPRPGPERARRPVRAARGEAGVAGRADQGLQQPGAGSDEDRSVGRGSGRSRKRPQNRGKKLPFS